MKRRISLFFVLLHLACTISAQVNYTINESWLFGKGIVRFPHTWNQEDTVDEIPGYFRGERWYKRDIHIGNEGKNKQISIHFEGANQITELFINGHFVGKHIGGYTRFSFDITPYIRIGERNHFEIKVDNSHQADIPPLSADFTFFGGIYRDVSLSFFHPIHISKEDFGSSGVYIRTPQVNKAFATIESTVILKNTLKEKHPVQIIQTVISPQKEIISTVSQKIQKLATGTHEFKSETVEVARPQLWSTTSPSLYTLSTILIDPQSQDTLDSVHETFGLRWFEFNADRGFFLNGEPVKLIGTNRHQCRKGMGNALPDEVHIEDINLLKNMGGNFLRISHYPQDPYILSQCDKLGIIASIEIPIVNAITESETFLANSLQMAEEMVKQNFNHPSLVLWGYMNEVLLQPPFKDEPERHKVYCKEVNRQAKAIDSLLKKLDPSRDTSIFFHGSIDAYKEAGLVEIPDVIGWNLYQGWYGGGFNGFDSFLDGFHKEYPSVPITISEYGADADPRLHTFMPERFDYTIEYSNLYHEHYLKAIMKRPFVAGASIWNLNDFHSEARGNAVPHLNSKGITGDDRTPKDTYYLYQAHLLQQPFIAIGSQSWKHRAGVADSQEVCTQPLKIYTNQPEVEISLNGRTLGVFPVRDRVAEINIPFVHGTNKLRAYSTVANGIVEDFYTCDFQLVPAVLSEKEFQELNVMLGSNRYFESKSSYVCWIPEQPYSPGSWGYIGGTAFQPQTSFGTLPASDLDILNTEEDPIFQTQRVQPGAFKADVPNGEYAVYLYWAHLIPEKKKTELVYNLGNDALYEKGGDYIFDVIINGKEFLKDFNIPQQIGAERAIIKKAYISVCAGEGLNIHFNSTGKSYLNAIRIVRLN